MTWVEREKVIEDAALKAGELTDDTTETSENDDNFMNEDSFEESLGNKDVISTSDPKSVKVVASTSVNSEADNESAIDGDSVV